MEVTSQLYCGAVCKYVSRKLSKVRFLPTLGIGYESKACIVGTWDDSENRISVYDVPGNEEVGGDAEPQLLNSCNVNGDVTGLEVINEEYFISSVSSGAVAIHKLNSNSDQAISVAQQFMLTKQHEAARVTDVSNWGSDQLVSVDERGRLIIYGPSVQHPKRIIAADSCALHCACFLSPDIVAVAGSSGQMRLWDTRTPDSQAQSSFSHNSDVMISCLCVASHPTQRHVLVVGDEMGSITAWDTRHPDQPPSVNDAHSAPVWEVKFHAEKADHLFTCSEDGGVWHWDGSHVTNTAAAGDCTWFLRESSTAGLEVTQLAFPGGMSVNSIDVSSSSVVCGTDSEQLQLYTGIRLR